MLDVAWVDLCWCPMLNNIRCHKQWRKVWSQPIHIEYSVQTKEMWNVELEGVVPYHLGDGVWPISEHMKLAVGSSKVLLLQM